jgi:N-acetyl-anhydromuramoyl-L-alanine amidase
MIKKPLMIENNGLLRNIRHIPSPNYDLRPPNTLIDLLVIHNISLPPGQFGGHAIDDFFCNCLVIDGHPYFKEIKNLKVSAHLLIRRNGSITQYVSFLHRAWHAGVSAFRGRDNCNDFSIGIELEGADDIPYTSDQYQRLSLVTKVLMQNYSSIVFDRIVGHVDIAPSRKTDPGPAFDWVYFRNLLKKEV